MSLEGQRIVRIPEGYLRLRIELQAADDGHPLIAEEADCVDIFDVVHELNNVAGIRFRDRLNDAALIYLQRRQPPDPPPDAGSAMIITPTP